MTSAAPLLNTPQRPEDWDRWSFDLSQNVSDILAALRSRGNVAIQPAQLYPIPSVDMQLWLERVSGVLGEICEALGVQSADVENVELDDAHARQAWVNEVFTEVNAARQALRI